MSWGPHKDSQRCCDAFSLPLSLYVWSLSLNCNRLSIGFDDHVALFQDELQATYTIAESKKSPSSTRELRRVRDKEKNQSQIQPQAKLSKLQGETRNDDRQPTLTSLSPSTSAHFRCSRARQSRQQRRQVSAASDDDGDGGLSLAKKGNRCCLNLLLLFKTTQCAGNLTHTHTQTL